MKEWTELENKERTKERRKREIKENKKFSR
jgi:hypothetical protein